MKETRNTIQKEIILQTLIEMKNHPTADQICKSVQKKHPSISKATVYRNLNKLDSIGKIKHIEISDSAARFDYFTENHCHVKCNLCGKVSDIDMLKFKPLLGFIKNKKGFDMQTYEIIFKGICPDCKKNKKTEVQNGRK